MSDFRLSNMPNSSLIATYRERGNIQTDPDYQREGGIWPLSKRQLLIDSLLNGFDLPKFYLHEFYPAKRIKGVLYNYAIIDGKQRLETIWRFIDGEFPLDPKFVYLRDPSLKLGGLDYDKISNNHPLIRDYFNGITLSIVTIMTERIDLIEEMFYRLNEAAPLNAAEKRNAETTPITEYSRRIISNSFFKKNIPFDNKRYRHLDLAYKLLYLASKKEPADTKKVHLDQFAAETKSKEDAKAFFTDAQRVCGRMAKLFVENDPLLSSPGNIVVFFLLILRNWSPEKAGKITRRKLLAFDSHRLANRKIAEGDEAKADFDFIEFDRLQQTPNDKYSIKFKLELLEKFLLN